MSINENTTLGELGTGILRQRERIYVANSGSRYARNADLIADDLSGQDAIMQAVEDLPAGGGVIELMDGEFVVDHPLVIGKDNVVLRGQGAGDRRAAALDDRLAIGTRIRAASTFEGEDIVQIVRQDASRPVAHVGLLDLTIDGDNVGLTINGIRHHAFRSNIVRVSVFECSGNGLWLSGTVTGWQPYDCVFQRLLLGYNSLSGMIYPPGSPDSHASQIIAFANGLDGITMQGASHQLASIHTYNNGRAGIAALSGSVRNKVANWKSEQNPYGLLLDGTNGGLTDFQLSTANFKNNVVDHILLTGGVYRANLSNINIASTTPPTAARFGVNIAGAAVEDTRLDGLSINPTGGTYSTAAINDLGKRTLINNVGQNVGHPATAGHWSGKLTEGALVLDKSANKPYICIRGSWYPL